MSTEVELSVERVIETYDHLLWEAIIRVCGMALSKAFVKTGNSVRVVYEIREVGLKFWKERPFYPDPRGRLDLIKEEVGFLISSALPIEKMMTAWRDSREANAFCSNWCYNHFLNSVASQGQARARNEKEDCIRRGDVGTGAMWRGMDDALETMKVALCGFVRIGWPKLPGCICCPCTGEHLANTRELQRFQVNLFEPKRVGKDTYEFRFEIAE